MKDINYYKEQSVSLGAVVVGALAAASGVGLAAGIATATQLTATFSTVANLTSVGIGAGGRMLSGAQVQKGELDNYTAISSTHISSNLDFNNTLEITAQDDVNLTASHLTAENIIVNLNGENSEFNQINGENTAIKEVEHNKTKPNYLGIATSAAVSQIAQTAFQGLALGGKFGSVTENLVSWQMPTVLGKLPGIGKPGESLANFVIGTTIDKTLNLDKTNTYPTNGNVTVESHIVKPNITGNLLLNHA